MSGIYLALGSNLGNRRANIALALRMLPPLVRVEAVSALYESPAEDGSDQPTYYNAACRVVTGLNPLLLLRHAQHIERLIGRRSSHGHNQPRPIDIDIALFNDLVSSDATLTLPHARLSQRPFVLQPLLDIDSDLVEPVSGSRLEALLGQLDATNLKQIETGAWYQSGAASVTG